MTQTLLAFLAMMIVTLLSINQQQRILRTYEAMLDDEMEVMASGIALQAMEVIEGKAFDSATLGGASVSNPSALTALPFATGNGCSLRGLNTLCDDVDDFHEMTPDTLSFTMRDGATYAFEVTATVQYVTVTGSSVTVSAGPTYEKQITVSLQDVPATPGGRRLLINPVRLSRLKACDTCS
ncbi:MAG: hypothetical protein R2834_04400 [Rhodothermales bacterium]